MKTFSRLMSVGALAAGCAIALGGLTAHANRKDDRDDRDRGDGNTPKVFVIAMENHNWTQPASTTSPQPLFQNPAAPFLNGLVNGTSGISGQVSYAITYLNSGVGVHPSEPNYIWAEAGDNLGVFNDDAPYKADCSADTVQSTNQHLSAFLTRARKTWRSYQEDTNVTTANVPLPSNTWRAPIFNTSGNWANGINAYNYATQFNYAAKHNPMIFFTDTNGGCPAALSTHYPPLQQLAVDLQDDTVADYNWITPNQFNDQHTALTAGYGAFAASSDGANIAQGDNFLARAIPLIMASKAYKEHGIIVLWWDETEGGDGAGFRLPFVIISKDARANMEGVPFASGVEYSHSSFLRTMQEVFGVDPQKGFNWLGAAATANDLSAMFKPGTIK
jgi:hypothetical protein